MRSFNLVDVKVKVSASQHDALSKAADRPGLSWEGIRARIAQAAQDGAAREVARLTGNGPESAAGWQQRCNACREARAAECAECGGRGSDEA